MKINKTVLIIVGVVLLSVAVFYGVYSYFSGNDKDNNPPSNNDKVDLTISDPSIIINDIVRTDESAYKSKGYSKIFAVTNNSSTVNTCAKVYIEFSNISDTLKSRYLRWKIESSDGTYAAGDFTNASTTEKKLLLRAEEFPTSATKTYMLYIWFTDIEESKKVNINGASLNASVVIEGTKTTGTCE